jgi:pimeloyl-ACP methyl ester carboxylesterase
LMQLFVRHISQAMDWVTATYGVVNFSLVGHSGGGFVANNFAAIESRFLNVHCLQGAVCSTLSAALAAQAATAYYTLWSGNDVSAAIGGATNERVGMMGAFAGRKAFLHVADLDEYDPGTLALWQAYLRPHNVWYSAAGLGTIDVVPKTTQGVDEYFSSTPWHNVSQEEAAFVELQITGSNL